MENNMEKDNKTDSKKNPKANADHPDDGIENKTKNKGSYTHRGFKKASEVKHQPGLQVNIPIESSKPSEQISNIPRNSKMTSEEVDENKIPNTDSPDK